MLTTSGAERKACIWLKMRQFKPYWPRYKGTVKLNRHRRDTRWRSVIAGYVFVPLPEEGELNWQLAERTPGIRAIARPDNTHIILNSSDINEHQVDVQAPAPVQVLGQQLPAEQQADRAAGARDGAEDTERLAPILGASERGGQQRQRGRGQQRAEGALAGRAATSTPKLPPRTADAPAKPASPAMNVALRPIMSVRTRPPSSSRLPKASA